MKLNILRLCLFVSGGVALVLQMGLEKYLSTLVGAASHSVVLVLVLFFVGVALGALVAPARCNGWRWLVFLELFIGAWAILTATGFYDSYYVVAALWQGEEGWLQLQLLRIAVAAFWLLPPTVAMGMHLPVCIRLLHQHGLSSSQNARSLYAMNVMGAGLFSLLVPYSLFYAVGVQVTLYVMGAVCLLVAASIYWAMKPVVGVEEPKPSAHADVAVATIPSRYVYLAFFSGALFFALEILWFHLMGTLLGSYAYTFSMLLGCVLLSLALGGLWVNRRMRRGHTDLGAHLRVCFYLLLVLLPVSAFAWPYLGHALAWVVGDAPTFYEVEIAKLALLVLVIVPVAVAAGAIYPLLFNTLNYSGHVRYSHMGRLLAFNTFGVVVGVLLMGYGLIEHLGSENAIIILWLLIGLHLAFFLKRGVFKLLMLAACGVVAVLASGTDILRWDVNAVNSGMAVYYGRASAPDAEVIYMQEEFASGISAIRRSPVPSDYTGKPYTLTMLSNGKFEGNDGWHVASKVLITAIASFFVPENHRALVIGLGTGHSSKVTRGLGFETAVCEISRERIIVSEQFFSPLHDDVVVTNKVKVTKEDGRQCLLSATPSYDLITADIGSLWVTGATNLYSQEFYQQVHGVLSKQGVFVKQLQPGNVTPNALRSVLATMHSVFPHVVVVRMNEKLFTVLASKAPIQFRPAAYMRYQQAESLAKERRYVAPTIDAGSAHWVWLDGNAVRAMIADGDHEIFTDYNHSLEFLAPRIRDTNAEATRRYMRQFAPQGN